MTERTYTILLAAPGKFGRDVRDNLERRQSVEVRTAPDAHAIVHLAQKDRPSLVIFGEGDGLDAVDACATFREAREHRTVPVVLITEDGGAETRAAAQKAGANAIIVASAGLRHVMYVVSELLRLPPRRRVKFAAVVGVVTLRGAKESLARAVNLSDGGIGIETNQAHPVETPVDIQFVPPGERQFRTKAVVRWVRRISQESFHVGLEFTEMAAEDRSRLLKYLERTPST